MRQIELSGLISRLAPRKKISAVGSKFVHSRVAVAVGDEHLSSRGQGNIGRQVERAPAVRHSLVGVRPVIVWRHTGVRAEALGGYGSEEPRGSGKQHHLRVVPVDEPEIVLTVGADRMRKRKESRSP